MSHPDGESLALLALGEQTVDPDLERHLASCASCAREFEALRSTVDLCRDLTDEDVPTAPPDRVWDSIVAELNLGSSPVAATVQSAPTEGSVVDLSEHRRHRTARSGWSRGPLLAVAAAAVLGVAAGGVLTSLATGGDDSVTVSVVAGADLDPLPGKPFVGVAEVGQSDTGRVLSVEVQGPAPEDGYYEVWLLTPTVEDMISIGALDRTNNGLFLLPEGVDLGSYSVVDVSFEPFDGDPTHSSDSVVRGELQV